MMLWSICVLLFSFSGVTYGATFYSCGFIQSANCSRFSESLTCGTNLVTYKNKCEFSKAHCTDTSIDLRHSGACTPADGTTPVPVNIAGGDAVFDFFCTSLSHRACSTGGTKVCGTDKRVYENYCEYEKAKCTHRDLDVENCIMN